MRKQEDRDTTKQKRSDLHRHWRVPVLIYQKMKSEESDTEESEIKRAGDDEGET